MQYAAFGYQKNRPILECRAVEDTVKGTVRTVSGGQINREAKGHLYRN